MAEIIIAKTKLRRGTDAQRQLVVFDQGEPVFTTDTKRLFVGIGTAAGGTVIGSKVHPPLTFYSSLSNTNAQVGDLVYANNKFYELVAEPYSDINNWQDVGLKANPSYFSYDSNNFLQINLSSLSAIYLDPNTIGYALIIADNKLSVNFDPTFFSVDLSNALTLNDDSITEVQINSTSLSSGLRGGSGDPIQLDFIGTYLDIDSNSLTLKLSSIDEFVINPTTLSSGLIGGGNSKIQVDIDSTYLGFSGNKVTVNISGINDALPIPNFSNNVDAASSILNFNLSSDTLEVKIDNNTIVALPDGSLTLNTNIFGEGLDYNTDASTLSVAVDDSTIILSVDDELSVNPNIFGVGLTYDTSVDVVSTNLVDVDYNSLTKNEAGILSMSSLNFTPLTSGMLKLDVDIFGRIVGMQTGMYDLIEIDTNGLPENLFNGASNDNFDPFTDIINTLTIVNGTTVSTNTGVSLSSAGMLAFEGGFPVRGDSGMVMKRFAIPVFVF